MYLTSGNLILITGLEDGEVVNDLSTASEVGTPSDITGLTSAGFVPAASYYGTVIFALGIIAGAVAVKRWF